MPVDRIRNEDIKMFEGHKIPDQHLQMVLDGKQSSAKANAAAVAMRRGTKDSDSQSAPVVKRVLKKTQDVQAASPPPSKKDHASPVRKMAADSQRAKARIEGNTEFQAALVKRHQKETKRLERTLDGEDAPQLKSTLSRLERRLDERAVPPASPEPQKPAKEPKAKPTSVVAPESLRRIEVAARKKRAETGPPPIKSSLTTPRRKKMAGPQEEECIDDVPELGAATKDHIAENFMTMSAAARAAAKFRERSSSLMRRKAEEAEKKEKRKGGKGSKTAKSPPVKSPLLSPKAAPLSPALRSKSPFGPYVPESDTGSPFLTEIDERAKEGRRLLGVLAEKHTTMKQFEFDRRGGAYDHLKPEAVEAAAKKQSPRIPPDFSSILGAGRGSVAPRSTSPRQDPKLLDLGHGTIMKRRQSGDHELGRSTNTGLESSGLKKVQSLAALRDSRTDDGESKSTARRSRAPGAQDSLWGDSASVAPSTAAYTSIADCHLYDRDEDLERKRALKPPPQLPSLTGHFQRVPPPLQLAHQPSRGRPNSTTPAATRGPSGPPRSHTSASMYSAHSNLPPSPRSARSHSTIGSARTALDVLTVDPVPRDHRVALQEADKLDRRKVYDALRESQPALAHGRGAILPIAAAPTVHRREKERVPPPLDFSYMGFTSIRDALAVSARAGEVWRGEEIAVSQAERHQIAVQEIRSKLKAEERLMNLYTFGEDIMTTQGGPSRAGAMRLWGPKINHDGFGREPTSYYNPKGGVRAPKEDDGALTIVRAKDQTYAFNQRKSIVLESVTEKFFNELQQEAAEHHSPSDTLAAVQACERDAQKYTPLKLYHATQLRLNNNDLKTIDIQELCKTINFMLLTKKDALQVSYMSSYSPNTTTLCVRFITFLDLSGCNLQTISALGLEQFQDPPSSAGDTKGGRSSGHRRGRDRSVGRSATPATSAAYISPPLSPSARSARSPTTSDRAGIVFATPRGRSVPGQREATTTGELANAHGSVAGTGQTRKGKVPLPKPEDLFDPPRNMKDPSNLRASVVRSASTLGLSIGKRPTSPSMSPMRGSRALIRTVGNMGSSTSKALTMKKDQRFPDVPFGCLRCLQTLHLHGNDLVSFREVLKFAPLCRESLMALTWHGNAAIDKDKIRARRAAVATFPRLSTLNFTALTAEELAGL